MALKMKYYFIKLSHEMNMKLSEFEKNTENPFLKEAIQQVEKNVVKKIKTMGGTDKKAILQAVNNEGEILGHTQFVKQIEVDEDQFAKIYLSNFSAFFDLQQSSIKVFGYILTQLKPNKDEFIFDREECMQYTEYKSDTSVFKGLTELLKNNIIARGKTDYRYFINPMIFFNGNRITFAKTYIKKREESENIKPAQKELISNFEASSDS